MTKLLCLKTLSGAAVDYTLLSAFIIFFFPLAGGNFKLRCLTCGLDSGFRTACRRAFSLGTESGGGGAGGSEVGKEHLLLSWGHSLGEVTLLSEDHRAG